MSPAKSFKCEILLGQPPLVEVQATSAVFPAQDGLVGILPGRAPLAAALGEGPLVIQQADGAQRRYRISGGVAYMNHNVLTILAEKEIKAESSKPKAEIEEREAAQKSR